MILPYFYILEEVHNDFLNEHKSFPKEIKDKKIRSKQREERKN
jgi:hypothetical protein